MTDVRLRATRRRAAAAATVIASFIAGLPVSSAAAAEDKRDVAVISRTGNSSPVIDTLRIVTATGAPVRPVLSRATGFGLSSPTWSRDETQLGFGEGGQIFLVPAAGGTDHKLTDGFMPAFSPARDEIAFWRSAGAGNSELRVIGSDGTNDHAVGVPFASATGASGNPPAWAPDGESVAVRSGSSIVRVSVPGGATTPIVSHPGATLWSPALSPDGTRIAYARQFPPSSVQELVVRDLASGDEKIAWQSPNANIQFAGGFPVIAWSADSDRIAYLERDSSGPSQITRAVTVKSDGSGGRLPVASDTYLNGIAWANAQSPSYYVKHVEVAQAISPVFGTLGARDPLDPVPYGFAWSIPSVAGFPIPLIAGRSTLLRIYVGDARMGPGNLMPRSIHYKLTAGSTVIEGDATVDVTANDLQPDQQKSSAAINAWVPGPVTASGATLTADVEVNAGEKEQECAGCYPNGNRAKVTGIAFEQGDVLSLAPVPIDITGPSTPVHPSPSYAGVWPSLADYLPVADDGVTTVPSGTSMSISRTFLNLLDGYACEYLVTELAMWRAMAWIPATQRWVGTISPGPSFSSCRGISREPGRAIVLAVPSTETLAHEFGHSLGVSHTLSLEGDPAGAAPLPYVGIGGVGYEPPLPTVHAALTTSDIMGYSSTARWTSPATWWRMHQAIVGHVISARSAPHGAARRPSKRTNVHRSRRLVSGYLAGKKRGAIFSSLVADATAPDAGGPTAGHLVARDRRGRIIARAKVTGRQVEEGSRKTLPFVVALPPLAKAAALELRGSNGSKLDTLRRSPHVPSARLLRLPRRVRAGKPLTVRWKASDRDRRDRLSVAVLARRGRGTWRTITMGEARGKATIKPKTLGRGKKLQLRLLVSDGFTTSKVDARPMTIRR